MAGQEPGLRVAVPTAPGAPVPRSGVGAGGTCVPQPYPEVVWAWGSLAHSWVSQACRQDWGHRGLCTGCVSTGQAGAGRAMPRLCPGLVPVPPGAAAQRRGWELGHCLLCPSPVGATAGHSGATRMAAPCPLRDPRGGGTLGSTRCLFDGESSWWALRCCPAQLPPVLHPQG